MLPTWSVRPGNDCLDELEHLVYIGVEEVFDDTGVFPASRWLTDFCRGFRERGLDKVLMMGCNMRADVLSQAEYEMLGASNFRFILNGIDSANHARLISRLEVRRFASSGSPSNGRARLGWSRT